MEAPAALVIAHPDDETLAAGAVLPLFRNLLIVQVTDGAPRNLADANAAGFATAEAYAQARARELQAALSIGGVHAQRTTLGAADQGATHAMPELARALAERLRQHGTQAVLTHAYEGGHPDHDATALIAAAAARLAGIGSLIEFPLYHAAEQGWALATFLPGPEPTTLDLTPEEQARKRAMLAAFATQQATLAQFPVEQERFRPAPAHDFTAPPHPGQPLYERYGWGLDFPRWQALATAARDSLAR
ncbi:PIG-L deacetylase family protein [Roseomonas populi]|uniref:PIG-L family deacetylase n=1 Tax=Roseomonas populi TaxID=3121582 RepID=A0ABT1X5F2_9PROT|nr:PIG-L family deacetylase [Roseomonas pecuniae]MCR0983333.1 PIG-L family deacetylase [Roseomonas pecuniae]